MNTVAFTELIKNFDKIRDYMRDFYIYGFKARGDFTAKSARTYDDERRRIESYLAPYVRWENDRKGKRVYVSLDTAGIDENPLYSAWKARSFTDNDITLHFAMLAALTDEARSISGLTDAVSELTECAFDSQTVRNKANEYVSEGLLCKARRGKMDYYALAPLCYDDLPAARAGLADAIRFFQGAAPFGFIGSTLMDRIGLRNDVFTFKHHYIVHTLEDGVLLSLLQAMREQRRVRFTNQNSRFTQATVQEGIPLRIFASVQSGRRYLCMYTERGDRFVSYRLDAIRGVKLLDAVLGYEEMRARQEKQAALCWGVSYGNSRYKHMLCMRLHIDEEKEKYVLERLKREGRGGRVTQVEANTFLYVAELYDVSEMMGWVKSFTGRILALESTDAFTVKRFLSDMQRMAGMYGGED